MKKHFLIAATAAALFLPVLSSGAFAAPREKASEQHQLSADHMAAFTDARIAALKAGLRLTTAQDKNWPALEAALREVAKDRAARTLEWREKAKEHHERDDVVEGLRLRAKGLSTRSAELERIADAAKPLYDSLDDAQKHRFGVLLHEVFKHHEHHWHWGMHPDEHSDEPDDAERQD
jgi:zinc resistance-associated protein